MDLLKNKLLASAQLRSAKVTIEGESYTVVEVGATEFAAYGEAAKADRVGATAMLLHFCLVGEDGSRLLTLEEAQQVAKSARVTMPLVNAIMEVSGFGANEKEPVAS